eukprot:SAG22_NODE_14545_length_372_cov_0.534799_1_plen_95_part_01
MFLLGQSLIDHDPRQYSADPGPLRSLRRMLQRADAVYTNLEVAVAPGGVADCEFPRPRSDPAAPRVGPAPELWAEAFFRAAPPSVLDFLQDRGVW